MEFWIWCAVMVKTEIAKLSILAASRLLLAKRGAKVVTDPSIINYCLL
ncbi:hypothetical protein [Prochlorococcus sp. MIT 1341]|nr:hypothetical protein [Prochlorococcus sp. MIT 1341]